MKRFLAGLLVGLVLATASWAVAAEQPIKLIVNGQEVPSDPAPRMIDNRVFVPVRFVAEALGADVNWDDANRAVVIATVLTEIEQTSSEVKAKPTAEGIDYYVNGRILIEYLASKYPDKKISGLGGTNIIWLDEYTFELPLKILSNGQKMWSVKPLMEAGFLTDTDISALK